MFTPHKFDTKLVGVPHIVFDRKSYEDMWYVSKQCSIEIGWFSFLRKIVDEKTGRFYYRVSGVLLPKQTCTAVTSDYSSEAMAELCHRIWREDAERGISSKSPEARTQYLRAWFHSHVKMGTDPSGVDKEHIKSFCDDLKWEIALEGICNHMGRMQLSLHYFTHGLTISDIPWTVEPHATDLERAKFWQGEIESHVSVAGSASSFPGGTGLSGFAYGLGKTEYEGVYRGD